VAFIAIAFSSSKSNCDARSLKIRQATGIKIEICLRRGVREKLTKNQPSKLGKNYPPDKRKLGRNSSPLDQ
jgi:hypothetical protein